ncbi:NF038396 family protein [Psychromicrobium xiongbiense]|uniref:NF038396 family protein n=1 Tax=Psychromicrobium xiongbiense TaxID=3051184 RepID=UPI00255352CF|nr:NF038396 family protein [Psychromicrobium sp. YIM S02556]
MLNELKIALKRPETLFVLGYMLLPLLALVTAILGLTMILGGNKILGVIVLVVVTQVFTFGAFFALRARKAALLAEAQHSADTAEPGSSSR